MKTSIAQAALWGTVIALLLCMALTITWLVSAAIRLTLLIALFLLF